MFPAINYWNVLTSSDPGCGRLILSVWNPFILLPKITNGTYECLRVHIYLCFHLCIWTANDSFFLIFGGLQTRLRTSCLSREEEDDNKVLLKEKKSFNVNWNKSPVMGQRRDETDKNRSRPRRNNFWIRAFHSKKPGRGSAPPFSLLNLLLNKGVLSGSWQRVLFWEARGPASTLTGHILAETSISFY